MSALETMLKAADAWADDQERSVQHMKFTIETPGGSYVTIELTRPPKLPAPLAVFNSSPSEGVAEK